MLSRKEINGYFINPRGHSPNGANLLFGDGHSQFVPTRNVRPDPKAYLGALDWSSPGWRDLE